MKKRIQKMGVKFLRNRTETIRIKDQEIAVTGLELPYEYYLKGKQKKLESRELIRLLGKPRKDCFQILLAQYPKVWENLSGMGRRPDLFRTLSRGHGEDAFPGRSHQPGSEAFSQILPGRIYPGRPASDRRRRTGRAYHTS